MTSYPCLNIELPASGVMGYLARLASKSKPGIFERKLSTGLRCFKHKEQLSGSSNWGVIPEVIILRFDRDVSEHVHVPMFQLHYPVPAESNSQRGSCETNRVCYSRCPAQWAAKANCFHFSTWVLRKSWPECFFQQSIIWLNQKEMCVSCYPGVPSHSAKLRFGCAIPHTCVCPHRVALFAWPLRCWSCSGMRRLHWPGSAWNCSVV